MTIYDSVKTCLRDNRSTWVVTGAAGFIGSHLAEDLLELDQHVVGIDNLQTGSAANIELLQQKPALSKTGKFEFIQADICDVRAAAAIKSAYYVLHQAALGSVPRSLADPLASHAANVDGFLNILNACRDSAVRRLVFASSSSVYGDDTTLPKVETVVGSPLSPYAATKQIDELYAGTFARCYKMSIVGLRYFNVFGPRQNPTGPYAAVIPRWFEAARRRESGVIYGDGSTSRDFCYVKNVVQANILAAVADTVGRSFQVFNIACGGGVDLNNLYSRIYRLVEPESVPAPKYQPFRAGDIAHSRADISAAQRLLGYEPTFDVEAGLRQTAHWFKGRA